jgi:hypothetical protein
VQAALGGDSDDLVLNHLIELTLASIRDERPLFQSIMEEPAFWRRHFRRWMKAWIEEEETLQDVQAQALKDLINIPNAL